MADKRKVRLYICPTTVYTLVMKIKRTIAKKVLSTSKKYQVVSITGPRQSGKTTLAKLVFPEMVYTNLEIPETRTFATEDPNAFLAQGNKMIIDEIQHVPELLSYIQGLVDSDKKERFVITGSQNLLISGKVAQSLAGRVSIFNLLPLSVEELKNHSLLEKNLVSQLHKGMYPKIYGEKLDAAEWYDNYIQTYLERDVRQIKNVGDLALFQKFMGLLAGRTGQILNLTSLSNVSGVSVPTISSWLSILEASYIIYRLQPYHKNFSKRLTKSPKIHFADPGLVCALLNINSPKELTNHPLLGNIFESFVFSEYLKKTTNHKSKGQLYYWREKSGREVDLLTEEGSKITAIEIKAAQTLSDGQIANLAYFRTLSNQPVKMTLVYGGNKDQKRSEYSVLSWRSL